MELQEALLQEFAVESALTRKMLERTPFDQPNWKPHEKSMTIQRLSSHIAELPIWIPRIIEQSELEFTFVPAARFFATDLTELLAKYDTMLADGSRLLLQADDEQLMGEWTLRRGDHVLFNGPRFMALRRLFFNHTLHHRGQLSVYLRLNDIAVPGMYGPSADEMPKASAAK